MSEQYMPTQKELANISKIRNQYISREINKLDQINRLDRKVKNPGKIVASILGASGSMLLGAGMSQIMVWENMNLGLRLGIPGLVLILSAIPLYSIITGMRRKKFAAEIILTSDEVLENN